VGGIYDLKRKQKNKIVHQTFEVVEVVARCFERFGPLNKWHWIYTVKKVRAKGK